MKKILWTLMIALTMGLAQSCDDGGVANTPEKVAEKFMKSVLTGNAEAAKEYCTEKTYEVLAFTEKLVEEETLSMAKNSKPEIKVGSVLISSEGDRALVDVWTNNNADFKTGKLVEEGMTHSFELIKNEEGKWLVSY